MKRTPRIEVTGNQNQQLQTLGQLRVMSELLSRSRLNSYLGTSFGGARDLYEVLGYKRVLQFEDFWQKFERGALGKRIICAPVMSSWYGKVEINENKEPEETVFEKAWKELDQKLFLVPKLIRTDILAGIGKYAVLLMGFSGTDALDQPVTGSPQLLYVQPYHENNAKIIEWERDPRNPRYGKPLIYQIGAQNTDNTSVPPTPVLRVHYSRVLHVADGLLENDIYGTERLRSSFNRVDDLEKLVGGSAEMFWQGALGGKAFKTQEGATMDMTDTELQAEIDEYIHGLRRYMRLDGIDVENMAPDIPTDPTKYVEIQLQMISGDTGIPVRILVGSERGELASSQDEGNWNSRMQQRREQYNEPFIVRPFIDTLIQLKVLPTPKENKYNVNWTPLASMDEATKATVAKTKTEALAAYVNAQGASMVVPEEFYLQEVLDFTQEQIDRIRKIFEKEPPPTKAQEEIEYHQELEDAEMTPEQRQQRLVPETDIQENE